MAHINMNSRSARYNNHPDDCGCNKPKPKPIVSTDCDKIVVISGKLVKENPYIITKSGVYHLCGDINWCGGDGSVAIIIDADNVVLNLKEFHIIDMGSSLTPITKNTAAILVKSNSNNYIITNGTIDGFGANGIYVETKTVNGDINNLIISNIGSSNDANGIPIRGSGDLRPVYYGGTGLGGAVVSGIVISGKNVDNYWSDATSDIETNGLNINNVIVSGITNYGVNTLSVAIYTTGVSDVVVNNCQTSKVKGGNTAVGIGGASMRRFRYENNSISDTSSADGVGSLNVSFSAYGSVDNNVINDAYNIYGVAGFTAPNPNRYVNCIAGNFCNTVNFRNNSTSNAHIVYNANYLNFATKFANGISVRGSTNTTVYGHIDTGSRNEFYRQGVVGAFTGNSYMIRSTADLKYPNSTSLVTIQNQPYTACIKNFVSNASDVGLYFDGVDGTYGLTQITVSDTQIYWSKKADLRMLGKVENPQFYNTNFRTTLIQ